MQQRQSTGTGTSHVIGQGQPLQRVALEAQETLGGALAVLG